MPPLTPPRECDTQVDTSKTFVDSALEYAARGWHVYPTCWPNHLLECGCGAHRDGSKPGKQPLVKGAFNAATIDVGTLHEWGRRWPHANIAVSLGHSGIVALDPDTRAAIDEVEASDLPATAVVRTGRGRHYYFRRPPGCPQTRMIHSGASGQIDILTTGGLILPPSTHYTGATYEWITDVGSLAGGLPLMPDSWLSRAMSHAEGAPASGGMLTPDGALTARTGAECPVRLPLVARQWWDQEAWVLTSEGKVDRSNTIAKLSMALARNGVREVQPLAELLYGWDLRAAGTVGSKYANRPEAQRDGAYLKLAHDAIVRTENARITVAESFPVVITRGADANDGEKVSKEVVVRDAYLAVHPHAIAVGGIVYDYSNGLYSEVSEYEVSRDIQTLVGAAATSRLVESVYKLLKGWIAKPDSVFVNEGKTSLVFTNGTFDFEDLTFRDHSPADYSRYSTGYAFDEHAECPSWMRFLSDRFSPDVARFLQEFAGLCLTRDMRHEVAVFLHSPPGAGKSTFIYGLQVMLGPGLWATVNQKDITARFGLQIVESKTLLLATEQPYVFFKDTSTFNSIISGDPVTVERKFKDAYTIYPVSKLIWAMNEPLRVANMEDGIFRRIACITMHPIPANEMNHNIRQTFDRERAGIINWAIAGACRLFSSGEKLSMRLPAEVRETTREWASEMDIAGLFVKECVERGDPGSRTWPRHLYARYVAWCKDNGYQPKSEVMAAREWGRLGIQGGVRTGRKVYLGIRLINLDAIESIDGVGLDDL